MLFLKRYLFPGVLAVAAYLLLGWLCTPIWARYWQGCCFTVLLSYLIRICDDIADFEKDKKNNKVLLGKKALRVALICLLIALICAVEIWQMHGMLLPLGLILLGLGLKGKPLNAAKVLFVPAIIAALVNTALEFSWFLFIPAGIFMAGSVCLMVMKGEKE